MDGVSAGIKGSSGFGLLDREFDEHPQRMFLLYVCSAPNRLLVICDQEANVTGI